MTWEVVTSSAEETERLGKLFGRLVDRSAVLFLYGGLGAGKTCLTRGICRSLANDEELYVSSPSYTLMNHYCGRLNLYHFDLYRLSSLDDLLDIGFEDYLDADGIVVVEWADRAAELQEEALFVSFQHLDAERRKLVFEARGKAHEKLLKQLAELWRKEGTVRD